METEKVTITLNLADFKILRNLVYKQFIIKDDEQFEGIYEALEKALDND